MHNFNGDLISYLKRVGALVWLSHNGYLGHNSLRNVNIKPKNLFQVVVHPFFTSPFGKKNSVFKFSQEFVYNTYSKYEYSVKKTPHIFPNLKASVVLGQQEHPKPFGHSLQPTKGGLSHFETFVEFSSLIQIQHSSKTKIPVLFLFFVHKLFHYPIQL